MKVYPNAGEVSLDMAAVDKILRAGLKEMQTIKVQATTSVVGSEQGVALLSAAKGRFVADSLAALGRLRRGNERSAALERLSEDVRKVAGAMAEQHLSMATGKVVTRRFKEEKLQRLQRHWFRVLKSGLVTTAEAAKVNTALHELSSRFRAEHLSATVIHGDAHLGNYAVANKVTMIDMGGMRAGAPAALDVGRYWQSFVGFGAMSGLTQAEVKTLQGAFISESIKRNPALRQSHASQSVAAADLGIHALSMVVAKRTPANGSRDGSSNDGVARKMFAQVQATLGIGAGSLATSF
ncbi:MAG: phosphotransferase [Deltaproteobacteria bacterium]|nr:phosphotransferase [Deltaproteobacteria bacterium]